MSKLPWYLDTLNPAEVRAWLKYVSHRETDNKMLAKELRFMASELENYDPFH